MFFRYSRTLLLPVSISGFLTILLNPADAMAGGNMTVLDPGGQVFGGTNDVVFEWNGITNASESDTDFNMTIVSAAPELFFGAFWYAHHIRVFGPGTYAFETDNMKCESKTTPDPMYTKTPNPAADDIEITGCPGTGGATEMTLMVGPGQLGVHMLIDWNSTFDIDVVNVWDIDAPWQDATGQGDQFNDLWTGQAGSPPDVTASWLLVSRDADGDGINGVPLIDGPFIGFNANFNADWDALIDIDGDGVISADDNCPFDANAGQLDSDSDGSGNVCDAFPFDPNETTDSDGDRKGDNSDNCTIIPNPTQCDGDADGYGNHCDGDFNNDGIVSRPDIGPLLVTLGTANPVTDLNCNGIVNKLDINLFRSLYGSPPGPSALVP